MKYPIKRPKPTEKSIMLGIMSALGMRGWRTFRLPPSIYSGQKGVPDLLCIRWGVHVFIECKSPTGKLSLQQRHYGELIDDAGGLYIVAKSVDYAIKCCEGVVIQNGGAAIVPCKGMRLMVAD